MEYLNLLYTAILNGKLEEAINLTQKAVSDEIPAQTVIDNYMTKAMEEVGRLSLIHI